MTSEFFQVADWCRKVRPAPLTLNLLPTLMKLSLPAFCLESLEVLEFSNSSRTNLSFDSHTKLSKDMWRASLFFSTNRICQHKRIRIHLCSGRLRLPHTDGALNPVKNGICSARTNKFLYVTEIFNNSKYSLPQTSGFDTPTQNDAFWIYSDLYIHFSRRIWLIFCLIKIKLIKSKQIHVSEWPSQSPILNLLQNLNTVVVRSILSKHFHLSKVGESTD